MQGRCPCTPPNFLERKFGSKNLKNMLVKYIIFKVFRSPEPFAIFAEGKFAPSTSAKRCEEVFKKVSGGVQG
jgi:hypothetical protein